MSMCFLMALYVYRTFFCGGDFEGNSWGPALQSHINICDPNCLKRLKEADWERVLPLETQFDLLSCIPNYHWWQVRSSVGAKMNDWFASTSATSPRNRFIFSYFTHQQGSELDRAALIKCVFERMYQLSLPAPKTTRPKKRQRTCVSRPRLTHREVQQTLGIPENDSTNVQNFHSGHLCDSFTKELVIRGSVKWRIFTDSCSSVVWNNYEPCTKRFKVIGCSSVKLNEIVGYDKTLLNKITHMEMQ